MNFWKNITEFNKQQISKKYPESDRQNISLIEMLDKTAGKSSRRNFLKLFGYGISSALLTAACERPVKKAIPYLIEPEEVTPGKANYYASSFFDGNQYCSILLKVRDGRPIKVEGNDLSPITRGGTNSIAQASVLGLYDNARYQFPMRNKKQVSWQAIDKDITNILKKSSSSGKRKVILSSTIISPSTKKLISEFTQRFSDVEHIMYDDVSFSGMREANRLCFDRSVIPDYRFDKAGIIVSFGADFLGTWLSPVEFTKQYTSGRVPENVGENMSFHLQIESALSLTGSNADKRMVIKPSEEKYLLSQFYKYLTQRKTDSSEEVAGVNIPKVAELLLKNQGNSLIVSGSNDPEIQCLINGINYELGNYGNTINLDNPVYLKQGDDKAVSGLVERMNNGEIDTIMFYDTNPVYSLPNSDEFKTGLKKVKNRIALSTEVNETADLCEYVCPDHHMMESWNDYQPKENHYSLGQPGINNIFNTRQAQVSLLKWMGRNTDFMEYIKAYWRDNLFEKDDRFIDFRRFWNKSLQDGVFNVKNPGNKNTPALDRSVVGTIVDGTAKPGQNGIELHIYENVAVSTGKYANNPWLQELPDPISKVCWDNCASVSPSLAEEYQLDTGDVITINDGLEIPVQVQPGQEKRTISVPVGYGRTKSGKVGQGLGVNIYPLLDYSGGHRIHVRNNIEIKKTGKKYELADTQLHNSMEERDIVRSMNLEEFLELPVNDKEAHQDGHHSGEGSLYEKPEFKGHHWGMVVDLNSCIGCNACTIACNIENNIPVVGREEVKQAHEMHWIRIDRYYSGDRDNPEVLRQPVMCQHCDNAPCENVCPVQATTHSSEGINQMAYNRCIGTRYCNNNCPYKVRRFNWHDYTKADAMGGNLKDPANTTLDLPRMALNPDVTVRAKGVIEKCTFCVQRIQGGKMKAKSEGRSLQDDDIKTACQQACPADAIVFGDMNDPESKVSKKLKNKRNYHLLEHLHTLPSVTYMNEVNNKLV